MTYPSGTMGRFPVIINVTMTLADTEYSYTFPGGCKGFLIHTRDETTFRAAYETGHVAVPTAPYFTVPAAKAYGEGDISLYTFGGTLVTLYFASASAGKIIEIIYWT